MVTKGFIAKSEEELAAQSDGRIIDYAIQIIDPHRNRLPTSVTGEICVKGPGMFSGYTDPQQTALALNAEGYFRTGDLGFIGDKNALVVTGRLKDIIIRGGENLSPTEIEAALERHPAILEAAVVAIPHPRLGEGVGAVLRSRPGVVTPDVREIACFLEQEQLARQKFPEYVEYVADFPRTASGKIRKDVLRATLRERLAREISAG
jgi:acyl-CoA synthetase (AMP-forming)/AMP-acid ligase II